MNHVRFTQAATESLLSIAKFIAVEEQDLDTAMSVLNKIESSCHQFAMFPQMGVARFDLEVDIRCFFVYDFVVIYKAEQEGIIVLDIIHSSRDVQEDYRNLNDD
jgi:plasmid stabilization system protein ParE